MSVGLNKNDPSKRMYPSGGAKYPCEIYIAANKVEGLDQGIYHYGPEKHTLTKINTITEALPQQLFLLKKSNFLLFDSAIIVFITFSPSRSIKKYGDFSYKLGLIEAGHIGQNFYLSATDLGLGCRAHAIDESEEEVNKINNALMIDGIGETFIYALSIGSTL
jgi:SagB-type dehydrogenase family enzyme